MLCGTMSIAKQMIEMELALGRAGSSVDDLCRAAGINRSSWTRWKNGSCEPLLSTWTKVREAFSTLTASSAAA